MKHPIRLLFLLIKNMFQTELWNAWMVYNAEIYIVNVVGVANILL